MVTHRLMAAMFFPFCYTVAVLKIHIPLFRWRHHQ